MHHFHLPMDQVLHGIPLAQAWALLAWATESSVPTVRVTDGYIYQEAYRRQEDRHGAK